MNRVQPEVTVVGSRFKLGPHQYRVKGHPEVYNTREEALAAYDETERTRQ